MKRKIIKIKKKTLARNILLAMMVVALAVVVPNLIGIKSEDIDETQNPLPDFLDLTQYPELCTFINEKGISTEQITEISILPRNISSNNAVYGSVLYFETHIKYYSEADATIKEFTVEDGVSYIDTAGLYSPNGKALMMSALGSYDVKLRFCDYETIFNVNITQQVVTDEKERLINKYARVSSDYTAGNITTSYDVNFVYGTDDEVSQMEKEALNALYEMLEAAKQEGYTIYALSGYRSYELQDYLYQRAGGDSQNTTAPPGGSEHQSGLAMDMTWGENYYSLSEDQENTSEFDWLNANCYKYGFILRYTKGYEDVTGYIYEPWHFRYLGKSLAEEYHNSGAHTLEEFLAEPR